MFIEANVKKWGLAPVTGSLAPPPPYGSEQGSILLETGTKDGYTPSPGPQTGQSTSGSPYNVRSNFNPQHGRSRSGNFRVLPPTSPGPVRNSTDISLAQLVPNDEDGETSGEHQQVREENQPREEHHSQNPLRLHLEDATNPPPDYTSPTTSDSGHERRDSTDSEDAPLIHVVNRSRGNSRALTVNSHHAPPESDRVSPVPSYRAAVRQGAGQARRDSSASEESVHSHASNDSTPE